MAITFTLNGGSQTVDVNPQTPLLWVLRDVIGLTGTKFGCGMALCGACTVHLNGQAVRSCQTPVGSVSGQKVTVVPVSRVASPLCNGAAGFWST